MASQRGKATATVNIPKLILYLWKGIPDNSDGTNRESWKLRIALSIFYTDLCNRKNKSNSKP